MSEGIEKKCINIEKKSINILTHSYSIIIYIDGMGQGSYCYRAYFPHTPYGVHT